MQILALFPHKSMAKLEDTPGRTPVITAKRWIMRWIFVIFLGLCACQASTLPVLHADLGTPRRAADLLEVLDEPGPLTVQTVASAQWQVALGGLLDLTDPRAQAAGLMERDEPITVYFQAIHHPTRGLFLIDTGVETAERDDPAHAKVQGLVRRFMQSDKLHAAQPLGAWLNAQPDAVAGVLFTHLHIDHIWGVPDLPPTPLYVGPGESTAREFQHLFVQGPTDALLAGQKQLLELAFQPDADGRFAGLLDVFGDGTLWAIWTPGHTPGSVAYIARTPQGPVLFTGDTCHTAWGWQHGVPPGTFTGDRPQNQKSLDGLRKLAAEHPAMQVRLGHQAL